MAAAPARTSPSTPAATTSAWTARAIRKGLTREQMSVQARVMGIADIFEALTAKDRPYKNGKTLSESLAILGASSRTATSIPDLFDIFVRDKVYLRYAREFLDPEQIDEVDERAIPGLPALTGRGGADVFRQFWRARANRGMGAWAARRSASPRTTMASAAPWLRGSPIRDYF